LLETGIYENEEVEELKKKIQSFEKLHEIRQKQREKFKEEIKTLYHGASVLVIDFSFNLKLNLELVQKNKDHYNQPQRTLFCATLVYVDENENRKFFYFDIISEILDHNTYFVNKVLFKILNHSVFKSHQIKELKTWCDNAKHFKSQELFYDLHKFRNEFGLQKNMRKVIAMEDLE
jgi:hypothetical protein